MVWSLGAVPASARPRRTASTGEASRHSTTITTGSTIFALRDTNRPHAATNVCDWPSRDSSIGFMPRRPRSILWPSSDSTAGSSELASSTAVSTPSALPMPSLVMKSMPITARPVIEMATVTPAKITARAAVAPAAAAASCGVSPSCSSCRNLVTMNSV